MVTVKVADALLLDASLTIAVHILVVLAVTVGAVNLFRTELNRPPFVQFTLTMVVEPPASNLFRVDAADSSD